MKKFGIVIGVLVVLGIGYYLISPVWRVVVLDEAAPVGVSPVPGSTGSVPAPAGKTGVFVQAAHDVSGRAMIVKTAGGDVVRFEDFKTLNGPDLRIYLSADREAKDFIDLGAIRATEGSVNYPIPAGTDLAKYRQVLVWCRAFSVLFGYAELR